MPRQNTTLPFRAGLWAVTVCSLILVIFFSGSDISGGESTQLQNNSITLPQNFSIDGQIGKWESTSPTFTLHKFHPNSRDGVVWLGQTDKGIVIAGKAYGDKPRWPKSSDKMAESDHVEVWLADANDLKMPPIGWGNQFGFASLITEEDCNHLEFGWNETKKMRPKSRKKTFSDAAVKDCREWFAKQVNYRKTFSKLFVRQWQIAPNIASETYSAPAFYSFVAPLQKELQLLEPSGSPVVMFNDSSRKDHAYSFELLIPWNAFPPMKLLQLGDIRIMVDVFNPGTGERKYGEFSSTASQRKYGHPDTFNALKLDPRAYFLTPCKYDVPKFDSAARDPLYRYLYASISASTYFMPTANRDVSQLLLLDNDAGGYQWNPDPRIHSPIVSAVKYYTAQISAAETICVPQLSYVNNGKIYKSTYVVNFLNSFEAKKKSDSSILVKEGPMAFQTRFGSGQCGTCPRAMLNMYSVDAITGEIIRTFEYEKRLEGLDVNDIIDIDIHVSENWDTLTVFEERLINTYDSKRKEESGRWSATKYCLSKTSKKFEECGKKDPSPPPAHRVLTYSEFEG